jgi:hypothetical protein
MYSSAILCDLVPLRPKGPFQHTVFKHPQTMFQQVWMLSET